MHIVYCTQTILVRVLPLMLAVSKLESHPVQVDYAGVTDSDEACQS